MFNLAHEVLFATGYAQKANERHAMWLGRVLFKPVRQAELVAARASIVSAKCGMKHGIRVVPVEIYEAETRRRNREAREQQTE